MKRTLNEIACKKKIHEAAAGRQLCREATAAVLRRGVTLPGSQQRLPRARELELGGRGAPYGVTHTHFAIVSRSALVSKFRRCCKQNIRLAVASFWSFDC
jgi:hypothetical protein